MGCRLTGMRITRAALLYAGLLSGCVASDLPAPSQRSPASVHAEAAAPRRVASSLEVDPLNQPGESATQPKPAPAQPEHPHHHHHSHAPQGSSAPVSAVGDGDGTRTRTGNLNALAADSGIAGPPADGGTPAPRVKTEYVCPMHPDVRQATPGRCPKCGMQLTPKSAPDSSRTQSPAPAPQGHSALRRAASAQEEATESCLASAISATTATSATGVRAVPARTEASLCGAAVDAFWSIPASSSDPVASNDRAD